MKQIATALLEAQKKIQHATKDAKNPHFRNDYATLESVIDAVKSAANSCGIFIAQTTGRDEGGMYLETRLIHSSGEEIGSKLHLVLDKPGMQPLGSALTYARRYSLAAIFCISQVDDDANGATEKFSSFDNKPLGVNQNVSRQPVQSATNQPVQQPVRFGNPRTQT